MKLLGWKKRDKNAGIESAAAHRFDGAADGAAVLERLDEALGRRLELGRPLAIVLTAPMLPLLPVDSPSPAAVATAAEIAMSLLKPRHFVGWLERDRLLIVMPDGTGAEARRTAFEWSAEMQRRCPREARLWRFVTMEAGDAASAEDVVASAYERLKVRRAA